MNDLHFLARILYKIQGFFFKFEGPFIAKISKRTRKQLTPLSGSGLLIWHESTFFSNRLHLLIHRYVLCTTFIFTGAMLERASKCRSFIREHFLRPFFVPYRHRWNAGNSWKIDIYCPIIQNLYNINLFLRIWNGSTCTQVMRVCNDVKKMYKEKGHLNLLLELSDNIFLWKNKN